MSTDRAVPRLVRRLAFELMVVLLGVFLAIRLEAWSNQRSEVEAAVATLGALQTELKADRAEIEAISEYQASFGEGMRKLAALLASGASENQPEIRSLIAEKLTPNPTWFPQSAAYNTLVTTGQLSLLKNSDLQVQLARLHQRSYNRLIYNGELYDKAYLDEFKRSVTTHWDYGTERLFSQQPYDNRGLANVALRIGIWSDAYQAILAEYTPEMDAVLRLVQQELDRR